MIGKFLKNISKYLALGVFLLPFSTSKTLPPSTLNEKSNGQRTGNSENKSDSELNKVFDIKHILSDTQNREYAKYIVNNTINQIELGIHPDGNKNIYLNADSSNTEISSAIQSNKLKNVLLLFYPNLDENSRENYLKNYKILIGPDVDFYLESIRKGSWGTTIMSVDSAGKVHFDSLSLRSSLVAQDPQIDLDILQKLVVEEFFQAHQYNTVISELYNNGYFSTVAGIDTPESLMKEISVGNLRAFLELFPQQKYLSDTNLGRNSYNYYIGNQLYSSPTNLPESIQLPYTKLRDFFEKQLGIIAQPTDFLNPEFIRHTNDDFRSVYLEYYRNQGYKDNQIQIWNLVGMKRKNTINPENSLDLPALLSFPMQPNT